MIQLENLKQLYKQPEAWIVAILVTAVAVGWPVPQSPRIYPDSAGYIGMSSERMPAYSLLASMLRPTYALVCVQFALSLAAWSWLGHTVGRVAGVLLGACFAVSVPIYAWNLLVLSESLSLSLLAASLASTILLYRRWSWARFAALCVFVVLFSLTRSANVFLVPFLVVPFVVTNKRALLRVSLVALVLLATVYLFGRTVGGSLRAVSLANVYTGRILADPDRRVFFVERGMPLKTEMEPYIGKTSRENAQALFDACPEFAEWFDEEGASMYYRWVFTQPGNYKLAAAAVANNLNFMNLRYTEGTQFRLVPEYLMWLYAGVHVPSWIWLAGLLPILSWRLLRRVTPDSLLIPALLAGIYVLTFVNFHGDRAGLSRHLLVPLVLCKVILLMTIAFAIAMVVTWRRKRQAAPARSVPAADKQRRPSASPRSGRKMGKKRKQRRR